MNDTRRADIVHLAVLRDPTIAGPERAGHLDEYLGNIVSATTAWPHRNAPAVSALRCRRRPNRKACHGYLSCSVVGERDAITWNCTACSDRGVISGWRGTPWDLTYGKGEDPRLSQVTIHALVSPEEFRALLRIPWYDDDVRRTILSAQALPGQAEIWGTSEELDDLLDVIAAESNHAHSNRWRRLLDAAFDRIDDALRQGGTGV